MVHWLGNSCLIPKLAWEVNPGYWGGLQVCICLCTFTLFVVEITKVNLWSWEYLQLACYVRLWVIGPRQYPLVLVSFKDWICATVCLGVLTVVGGLSQRWLADFTDSDCYWWCWPLLFKQNGALSSGGHRGAGSWMKILGLNHQFVVCMLSPCLQRFSLGTWALFYGLEGIGDYMHRLIGLSRKFDFGILPTFNHPSLVQWRKSNNW